ncbi:MAG: hypothetical protein ACYCO9_17210 [Streptosporangiaceae bacterium]
MQLADVAQHRIARPLHDVDDLNLTARRISNYRPGSIAPGQPEIWTAIDFEAADADAEGLAKIFAGVLDEPGWYANLQSATESFVVLPGRIFRYPRGDASGRAQAQSYGRRLAVPEPQLDWTV